MLFNAFTICAVVGGTVFLFQFALLLIGFGSDSLDFDVADDLPDDVPDDVPTDFHGDVGGNFDSDHGAPILDHGSTWFFGVVTFRTVVAAVTFFGLVGMATIQSGLGDIVAVLFGCVAGITAMYSVHWLMRKLYSLRQDGTLRIQSSIGLEGTVYIPIPPSQSGTGKVQLQVQGRIAEYPAMTSCTEKLITGTRVVVVDVVTPTTLSVEPLLTSVSSE
ncbi:MAG: hypothetical protein R3C28_15665 [Pirellulaceae bacterium]